MEDKRNVVVHLEMKFGTAFVIGLGLALAGLVVVAIPWIIMFLLVLPASATWGGRERATPPSP